MGIQINGQTDTIKAIDGTMTMPGTVTYEDVSRVNVTGIVTAGQGLHVTSGSVGIGTETPRDPVHIFHPTNNVNLLIESGDANSYLAFRDNTTTSDTAVYLGAEGNNLKFITSAAESLRITSTGEVNIGSNLAQTTYLSEISGPYNKAGLRVVSGAPGYSDPFVVGTATGGERFRITGDGNLGINTSSPSSYANFTNLTIQGGTSGSNLDFFDSSGVRKQAIVANASNGLSIECIDAGSITFNTNNVPVASIDSSGRLLVGTTSTTLPHLLNVNGSTKTGWFTCESAYKTVSASGTAVLTINGSNPSFVQVYIKANFGANGALQAHFDYELITCDAQGSGGTTAIRQSLNESTGSFQISTSDFAVTKSGQNIIITYTNQAAGTNDINFYVNGKFSNLSLA
jgi:hypothetical protein